MGACMSLRKAATDISNIHLLLGSLSSSSVSIYYKNQNMPFAIHERLSAYIEKGLRSLVLSRLFSSKGSLHGLRPTVMQSDDDAYSADYFYAQLLDQKTESHARPKQYVFRNKSNESTPKGPQSEASKPRNIVKTKGIH